MSTRAHGRPAPAPAAAPSWCGRQQVGTSCSCCLPPLDWLQAPCCRPPPKCCCCRCHWLQPLGSRPLQQCPCWGGWSRPGRCWRGACCARGLPPPPARQASTCRAAGVAHTRWAHEARRWGACLPAWSEGCGPRGGGVNKHEQRQCRAAAGLVRGGKCTKTAHELLCEAFAFAQPGGAHAQGLLTSCDVGYFAGLF